MRLKVLLKPCRLVALSADAEEDAAPAEAIVSVVVVVVVVKVAVAEAEEGPLGHLLVLFVSSFPLRSPSNVF